MIYINIQYYYIRIFEIQFRFYFIKIQEQDAIELLEHQYATKKQLLTFVIDDKSTDTKMINTIKKYPMVQQVYIIIVAHNLDIIKQILSSAEREIELMGITFYQPEWSIQLFQILRKIHTNICFSNVTIPNDYLTNLLIDSLRRKNQITFDGLNCSLTTFNLILKLDVNQLIINKYSNDINDRNWTSPALANKHIGPTQVKSLTISNSNLAYFTHWQSLIDFSQIVQLRLINCKLTDFSIKFLSQAIQDKLRSLDLSSNLLTRKSLIYLMNNEQFQENILSINLNNNFIDLDNDKIEPFKYNIQLNQCQGNIEKFNIRLFSIAADSKEQDQLSITRLSTELFLSNVNQISRYVNRFQNFIITQKLPSFDFSQQETEQYTYKQLDLLAPFINWLTIYDETCLSQNLLNHRFVRLDNKNISVFSKMRNITYLKLDKSYTEREIDLLCQNLENILIIDASQSPLLNGLDLFDKLPSLQLLITQDKILCQKEGVEIDFQDNYQIVEAFMRELPIQQEMWQQFKITSHRKAEIILQSNQVKTMMLDQQLGRMPPISEAQKSLSTSTYYQNKLQNAVEASTIRQAERQQLLEAIMMSRKVDKDAGYKTVYTEQSNLQDKHTIQFSDYLKQEENQQLQFEQDNQPEIIDQQKEEELPPQVPLQAQQQMINTPQQQINSIPQQQAQQQIEQDINQQINIQPQTNEIQSDQQEQDIQTDYPQQLDQQQDNQATQTYDQQYTQQQQPTTQQQPLNVDLQYQQSLPLTTEQLIQQSNKTIQQSKLTLKHTIHSKQTEEMTSSPPFAPRDTFNVDYRSQSPQVYQSARPQKMKWKKQNLIFE